jgi:hypothetical protein
MGQDHSGELGQRIKDAWDFLTNHSSSEDITLTQNEVKFIYGNKGGLRICASLDGGSDKKFLNIANFIKQNYQKLKIEYVAASARDGKIEIENLQGQIKQYLKNYAGTLKQAGAATETINGLSQKIKDFDRQSKELIDYTTGGGSVGPVFDYFKMLIDNAPAHRKARAAANNARATKQELEKNISSAVSTQEAENLKFRKEYNNLINDLKNSVDIYQSNQQHLIEFRTNCAAEAVDYLKHNKNNIDNINKGKYKDKGNCKKVDKLLFACLVAAKSSSVKDRKIGFSSFSKIQKAIKY